MDDAKKLIHWALNLKPDYKAEISNFDWPQRFALNQLDYHFKFTYKEETYDGRGLAVSSEIALVKAIVEAIERTIIDKHQLNNSNGIAAHFDIVQATESALCELIERDVFLCNYLCVEGGVQEVEQHLLPDFCLTTVKEFENKNVSICFYELGMLLNRTVILAITNGFDRLNPFGCVIGLGASLIKEKAIAAAFSEVARNTVTYIDRDSCIEWHQSENDFFKEDNQNFSILEHGKLALSEEYGRWLWNYFLEKKKYKIKDNDIRENEIEINVLELDRVFAELGVKVVQARSKAMQNLFFNKTQPQKINQDRLYRYMQAAYSVENINLRTHPLA